MRLESRFRVQGRKPTVMGTGLVALDVVISPNPSAAPRLWAGGTCGNVLTILSYLGWKALPISRMNGDLASRRVKEDLAHWGVDLRFVDLRPRTRSPIIVQRILRDSIGKPYHTFSFSCPACGAPLPRYKPVFRSLANAIFQEIRSVDILFLDRVSPIALSLAEAAIARGALVAFEPTGVGDRTLFRKILCLTHIFKYSHQRFQHLSEVAPSEASYIEIMTLGSGGLRYRSNLPSCRTEWCSLDAYTVTDFKDTAGAGDWCMAGFLHVVGRCGLEGFRKIGRAELRRALSFGQALAAWNCRFEGARGGMYTSKKKTFWRDVARIMSGSHVRMPVAEHTPRRVRETFSIICGNCSDQSKTLHAAETKQKRQRSA